MRKKKKEISLTAQQRRQQRENELKKNEPAEPKKSFEELTEEEQAAVLLQQKERKDKRNRLTKIVALALAVVLAVGFITTGTILLIRANTIDNMKTNPIAVITIDNNGKTQQLQMELFYSQAPAAVANFIYLASNGFYTDTIFNATSGDQRFLSMSGFTSANTHRAREVSFVSGLKGFDTRNGNLWGKDSFKLSYRIKKVSNDPGAASRRGHLAFLGGRDGNYSSTYATSSTYLLLGESPTLVAGTSSTDISDYLTYVGKLTEESMEIVDQINAIADVVQSEFDSTKWSYANPETNPIVIKGIKITKLNSKLSKNILNNFEKFVLTNEDGLAGLAQWSSGNKTDGYYSGN